MTRKAEIHIPLMGGLGNQLFQLAAGLYIKKKYAREIRFSSSWFTQVSETDVSTARNLLIDDLIDVAEWSEFTKLSSTTFRRLSKYRHNYWLNESPTCIDPIERIVSRTKVIEGYFQKSKYVNSVEDEMLARFKTSTTFSPIIPERLEQRIAVHMRFGDYLTNPKARSFHGLSHVNYYINAVKVLMDEIDVNQVLIVSDDPARAYQSFKKSFGTNSFEVSSSSNTNELEDLKLLSSSAGIVISNSTFSWWAAWLGSVTLEAKVLTPTPWFAAPSLADDLLPLESWTSLKRDLDFSS